MKFLAFSVCLSAVFASKAIVPTDKENKIKPSESHINEEYFADDTSMRYGKQLVEKGSNYYREKINKVNVEGPPEFVEKGIEHFTEGNVRENLLDQHKAAQKNNH